MIADSNAECRTISFALLGELALLTA